MIDTKLLRQKILDLAIRGKLVPQDPIDEPASELLKKIKAEKDALVKAGKIKKDKHESHIFKGDDNRYYETIDGKTSDITEEIPFDLPDSWAWCRVENIGIINPRNKINDDTVVSFMPMTQLAAGYGSQYDLSERTWLSVKSGFTHFAENDVVFAKITPCIQNRKSAVMRGLKNGYGAGTTELHVIRCLSGVIPEYILLFVKNQSFISDAVATIQGVVGQQRIDANFVKKYFLPLPPLAEQQRIVAQIETLLGYVDIIDTDAETLEKSITLAKQKILDLAIRGKLVPQDPTDEPASELLKKIKAEKDALVKAGKIKKDKHESYIFKSDDNCYYEQLNGKNVDITAEIPFELPESWCWCRLRSLGQIVGGGTPSTTNQMFWNGSIPWLSPADLTGYTEMYIAHGKKNITEEGLEKSSAALMPAGSILYSSRAPIGYVVISTNPISTNQGFKSLVPAIAGMSEFYYFVLKARTSDIKQRATGTTFKEISGNDFGNTLVPLPPITEQKRIVQAIAQYNSILELISK